MTSGMVAGLAGILVVTGLSAALTTLRFKSRNRRSRFSAAIFDASRDLVEPSSLSKSEIVELQSKLTAQTIDPSDPANYSEEPAYRKDISRAQSNDPSEPSHSGRGAHGRDAHS